MWALDQAVCCVIISNHIGAGNPRASVATWREMARLRFMEAFNQMVQLEKAAFGEMSYFHRRHAGIPTSLHVFDDQRARMFTVTLCGPSSEQSIDYIAISRMN